MADTQTGRPRVDADQLVRLSSIAVVVLVALGAAVVSYRHAYDLVHAHGETGLTAAIVPATVDGMIYASSMVLLQAARRGQRGAVLAYLGLSLGIVATVAANVAHGWAHGLIGALVGAWPAVALVLSYEMLMWIVRAGHHPNDLEPIDVVWTVPGQDQTPSVELSGPSECGHQIARNLAEAVIAARDGGMSLRTLAEAFGTTKYEVTKILNQAAEPAVEELVPSINGQHPTDVEQPE